MSLLCTNLVWQRQEAPTDWWHFIVIAAPLLNCSPLLLGLLGGLLPSERRRAGERASEKKTQRRQIEHIATVIHRKMINLTVKLLFWCCVFFALHFLFLILRSWVKQWCTVRRTERCMKLSHQPRVLNVSLFLKQGVKSMDHIHIYIINSQGKMQLYTSINSTDCYEHL